MNSVSRLAAATAATLLMGHAQATTVLHTSWISFLDAIEGGAYVETFNRLDSSVEPSSFSGLGYSYNMSAPGGLYASSTDVGRLPTEKRSRTSPPGSQASGKRGRNCAAKRLPSLGSSSTEMASMARPSSV